MTEMTDKNSASRKLTLTLSLGAALVIVLQFLFTFVFPGRLQPAFIFTRNWGFHFPAYYSLGWRLVFYSIAIGALFPRVGRFATGLGRRFYDLLAGLGKKRLLFLLASIASIPFFIVFRCRYALLGDNFIRATDIVNNNFIWHDSGTIFTLHYFYRAMHALLGFSGAESLAFANVLCGGVYVYLSLLIADLLGDSPFRKGAIVAAMFTSGLVQLFFGYLEITPPAYVLLVAHLYAALRYAKGSGSVHWPALLLVLAAGLCLVGLFFLPPFLYLIWTIESRRRPFLKQPNFIASASVVLLGIAWYPLTRWIIPDCLTLRPDQDHVMTLFSAVHFWEYLNGVLLPLGAGATLFPALLIYAVLRRKSLDLPALYLVAAFVSVGLGLFVFNEMLGSADADIFSVFGIVGPPAVVYLLIRLFDHGDTSTAARHGVFVLTVLMALHTGTNVGINATTRSIARIRDIVLPDPGSFYIHHPAEMVLAIIYKNNGLQHAADAMFERSYQKDFNDERVAGNYINALIQQKRFEKALPVAIDLTNKRPGYYPGLRGLYKIAQHFGNEGAEISALERMYRLYQADSALILKQVGRNLASEDLSALVELFNGMGLYEEADTVCAKMQAICQYADFSSYLRASIQYNLGNYDRCLALCRPLMEGRQKNHLVYLTAALAYERKRDIAGARTVLEQGMGLMTSASGKNALKAELDRLNRSPGKLTAKR